MENTQNGGICHVHLTSIGTWKIKHMESPRITNLHWKNKLMEQIQDFGAQV